MLAEPVDGARAPHAHQPRPGRRRARSTTALAGECARCLRPVVTPSKARIDEEVLPAIDLATGAPVPLEEGGDPEAPRLTDHHELELRPLVARRSASRSRSRRCASPTARACARSAASAWSPATATTRRRSTRGSRRSRAFRVDADDESG